MKFFFSFIFIFISSKAFGWGARGHDSICQASVHLVKNQNLKNFLKFRGHALGYLCNIPDTHWRSLSRDLDKLGAPTHYFDLDYFPFQAKDIPVSLSEFKKKLEGLKKADSNLENWPSSAGTLWWRIDQFYQRALNEKNYFKENKEKLTLDPKDEQNFEHPFNQAVYEFYINLGLMGHFVGDASMPFHNSKDYDGYEVGHGGIHSYYEDFMVSLIDEKLVSKLVEEAQKLNKKNKKSPDVQFLLGPSILEKTKALSLISFQDIPLVLKADLLDEKSKREGHKNVKAKRISSEKTFPQFQKLAIQHMARASALLANIWDQAFEEIGSPDLSPYKLYKFPHQPEFITPNY